MATQPVRIDTEDFAAADLAADVHGRSTAQQLAHWARIGREIEAAPSTRMRDVDEMLRGRRSYDDLTAEGAAVARARWRAALDERLAEVDLVAELQSAGRTVATLDADGNVVELPPEIATRDQPGRPTEAAVAALRDVIIALAPPHASA